MKSFDVPRHSHLTGLINHVRQATDEERPSAVGRALGSLIPTISESLRATPIESVKWSQPFATNDWWRNVWERLGVANLGDLATVGPALAQTRGVGRAKVLILLQDLVDMAEGNRKKVGSAGRRARSIEIIRTSLHAIETGPAAPHPYLVQALFHALIDVMPPELLQRDVKEIPWSHEWCYTSRIWEELGIAVVADLDTLAFDLSRVRGIGRGKVATIARDLIFLSPELHTQVGSGDRRHRVDDRNGSSSRRTAQPGRRQGSLVGAIDRFTELLSPRERDILRRRLGWRYDRKPEKLRTLAEAHGVSQERIRQIENQVRKRLLNLLRLRQLPETLRETMSSLPEPADLATAIACRPAEFRGMMDVWRPLASLLARDGGPYLCEDRFHEGQVVVSTKPCPRRVASAARTPRASDAETPLRCPSATTSSVF